MKHELEDAIRRICQQLYGLELDAELSRPDEQYGDYATNIAMQLSSRLGGNPRELAGQIKEALLTDNDGTLSDVEIAGPGFLNLRLSDKALVRMITAAPAQPLGGRTVVIEYSDPNPFKPLHAGHLYTTLVGDTIARLVENAGARTIRINYGGDVGLHVGKSMWAIIKWLGGELPEKLEAIDPANRPSWLGDRYVAGNEAYEDDAAAKKEIIEANKRVYMLHEQQDHDSPFARIYWTCRTWSYQYFAELYRRLHVVPFDRYIPESEVTPLGVATVREQLKRGVFSESEGAVVFDGTQAGLHTRVFINSEGLPTYETKDVGLSLTKWNDYHFDESIIITANEQAHYMQVVLAAIGQFAPEPANRTRHLTHGVVKLQGGVKMSSRKGNTVTALEILDAALAAGAASGTNPSEETILAAVKYAFSKNRLGADIIYDPKESIALEGNSGPYLQYAHARARSILARAAGSVNTAALPEEQLASGGLQPDERSLLRKLTEYAEIVERATGELLPHYICTYLYELAQQFNRFYEKNRVLGDEREAARLQLVTLYADTLKNGLELLGIQAPDHM